MNVNIFQSIPIDFKSPDPKAKVSFDEMIAAQARDRIR